MKLQTSLIVALLICTFCGCPPSGSPSRSSFTIVVINGATELSLTSLSLGTLGMGGMDSTGNLLTVPVAPDKAASVTVDISEIGDAKGLLGTFSNGTGFGIGLGQEFDAGITIYLMIANGQVVNNVQFLNTAIVVD